MTEKPIAPRGINHLVLNVRDIEEAHRFWTEVIGFPRVGELKEAPSRPNPPKMRFYSSESGHGGHHHELALVENTNLPPPPAEWTIFGMPSAINHIAITYPSRESWLRQLGYLQAKGIKFDRRVEHGITHSLYIHDPNGYGVELVYDLPREVWEGDLDAALNYAELLPTMSPTRWSTGSMYRCLVPRPQLVSKEAMPEGAGKTSTAAIRASEKMQGIPNASRIGNLIMSSVIVGTNPGTRELPESFEAQVANVFAHIRHDVEAAGGSVDDIIKVTFWVRDPASQRAALNTEWVKLFPNSKVAACATHAGTNARRPFACSGGFRRGAGLGGRVMLNPEAIEELARAYHAAEKSRQRTRAGSVLHANFSIDDAYAVQRRCIEIKIAEGNTVRGRKDPIHLTRDAVHHQHGGARLRDSAG